MELFCSVSRHGCIDMSSEEVGHKIRVGMVSYTLDFIYKKKDWKCSIKWGWYGSLY